MLSVISIADDAAAVAAAAAAPLDCRQASLRLSAMVILSPFHSIISVLRLDG